ncbi:Myb-like DNA-binding domain containing protein [Tritrichomonas foetus]|uniref:Myb-like DNA-binding domain containing protein n=1 Tax=Tritrichomonas foetus TaxID=1144522 RepID=A0A1J4K8I1_9EUKA|nr:Myb-like DNA-binding domain containing protein [Tritrichomonas foetus]|eukprot:OHT05974.1 Myb-like DNA-binding domain containing protein [Tritrichomonas foetus]
MQNQYNQPMNMIPQQPIIATAQTNKKHSIKVKFTPEEDEKLKMLVMAHGTSAWSFIAHLMGTRNHRQCRERWKNYINPSLRSDPWTLEEDQLLVDKYAEFGPKWNKIAKSFANRSDNSIRNRWQLMLRQWERQNHAKASNENNGSTQKNDDNEDNIQALPPSNL